MPKLCFPIYVAFWEGTALVVTYTLLQSSVHQLSAFLIVEFAYISSEQNQVLALL